MGKGSVRSDECGMPVHDDDDLPIQLENNALGCPRCRVELSSNKSRVFVDRIYIGAFDSLACGFCGFFLLTEKGFDESAKEVKRFGLDAPDFADADKISHGETVPRKAVMPSTPNPEELWDTLALEYASSQQHAMLVFERGGGGEQYVKAAEAAPKLPIQQPASNWRPEF